MAFSDLLERKFAEIYGEETFQFSLTDGNLLVEIRNLTIALMALVLAAVVIKVVAVCIEAQQQEDGEKAIWKRIKKVVMVGIVAICIGGVTEVITSYYADEASEYVAESSGGHRISADDHPHGGGGGHH